jgi:ABC-2 type transport system permease protein
MTIAEELSKALHLARKDMRVYYFKAPNFTYGLLMPVALYLAFSITGSLSPATLISGLVSLVILFGTMSIEAVSVVLEKQTGTFERLLAAPVSLLGIVLGKALAGFAIGPLTAIIVLIPVSMFSGTSVQNPLAIFVAICVSSFTFASMGIFVSCFARWTPEAQMYSNFFRFPMAFLSGTFIPVESMPWGLQVFSKVLPLTYSIDAVREGLNNFFVTGSYLLDLFVLTLFSIAFLLASVRVLQRQMS